MKQKLMFGKILYEATDSALLIKIYSRKTCKSFLTDILIIKDNKNHPTDLIKRETNEAKQDLIQIHGYISYDFFYRSKTDTPFVQDKLVQHSESVLMNVTLKNKYPLKLAFNARQSNSPFIRDLNAVNLSFDNNAYLRNLKREAVEKLKLFYSNNSSFINLKDSIILQKAKYAKLKSEFNEPAKIQRIVEERERISLGKRAKNSDSLSYNFDFLNASSSGKFYLNNSLGFNQDQVQKEKKESQENIDKFYEDKSLLSKLDSSIKKLELKSFNLSYNQDNNLKSAISKIQQAKNVKQIDSVLSKNTGIYENNPTRNFLMSLKTFSVGRSLIDYSELTAQYISVKGINIEYNPKYYLAFAAGKIDYGFRDNFGGKIKEPSQYLILSRMGWGDIKKKSFVLTIFNGRKNNYGGLFSVDSNTISKILGYSFEVKYRKNEFAYLSAEVAKSNKSTYHPIGQGAPEKFYNLFNFKDQSNLGISVKGILEFPKSNTKLNGFFRKTGEHFQSFSLFTYNTKQQAWQLKMDQTFFKKKLLLTAMLRQNDFINPFINRTYKTTTVFKTFLLNMKIRKWPSLQIGYFPGTQYYLVDREHVFENIYYMLNGTLFHSYAFGGVKLQSSIIFNRYINKGTNSGFLFYKGNNYLFTQSAYLNNFQLQAEYAFDKQPLLKYHTFHLMGDYKFKRLLSFGVGIKHYLVPKDGVYWGELLKINLEFKQLGSFRFFYEKSNLPTIQQTLYPVEIGRVSWFKNF